MRYVAIDFPPLLKDYTYFHFLKVPKDGWEGSTETMWFFDPRWIKEKRACMCKDMAGNSHMHLG